jgi:hypothetical protein
MGMMLGFRLVLFVLLGWLASSSRASIQLLHPGDLSALSTQCITALSANISCSLIETGNSMYDLTANITQAMLEELCTDECKMSISSFRKEVEKACSSDEFHDRGNATEVYGSSGVYGPVVLVDYYVSNNVAWRT